MMGQHEDWRLNIHSSKFVMFKWLSSGRQIAREQRIVTEGLDMTLATLYVVFFHTRQSPS